MKRMFLLLTSLLLAVSLAGCGGSGGGFSSGGSGSAVSKAQVVTGPTVVSASIVNGTTGVNTGALAYPGLTITFSEPMNPNTFYDWHFTDPGGQWNPVYYTWNADNTAVTFNSSEHFLSYGTNYTLTINNDRLLAADGTPLAAPFSVSFTTSAAPVVNNIDDGISFPTGLAIDNSTGDLWMADIHQVTGINGNGDLAKVSPTGVLIGHYFWWGLFGQGQLGHADAVGQSPVAIDSSGNAWTANGGLYSEFDSNGNLMTWTCSGTVKSNPYYSINCYGGTPSGMAIDPSGNIWAAIHGNGTVGTDIKHGDSCVLELSSTGAYEGVYAAGSSPSAIAIDPHSGNVWVTDEACGQLGCNGVDEVTELSPSGAVIAAYPAGPNPLAIAIDKSGDIWVANFGDIVDATGRHSSVTELVPSGGTYASKTYWAYYRPAAITTDSSGNVWMLNNAASGINSVGVITELSPSGEFINAYWPTNGYLNPATTWTANSYIAIDSAGNVWVTNAGESDPELNPGNYGLMEFVGIASKTATVTLSNLNQYYSGNPEPVTVTTNPSGLAVNVTYNGSATPPVQVGTYNVVATVTAPGYAGSATGTLTISVKPSPVQIVVTSSLTAVSGGYQATVKVTNNGGSTADNVNLTVATLGGVAGSPLPQTLGNIAGDGGSATATVTFPAGAGAPGTWKFLRLGGTYTGGGTFGSGRWLKLP
ncbi:MAG: MBG domain-containing protein [Nitrospiraceae bacterium]|nr:MBG domain-containing protein [Nitrospiraceae bacterium]